LTLEFGSSTLSPYSGLNNWVNVEDGVSLETGGSVLLRNVGFNLQYYTC